MIKIKALFIFLFLQIPIFGHENEMNLVSNIGISILAATFMSFIFHLLRQPLLLAYILSGVIIGPKIGFGFIDNQKDIKVISEIGLILLLFLIGLEIDIKKLKELGKNIIIVGSNQFILNFFITLMFFGFLGYFTLKNDYSLFYIAVCTSLSSTAIVVKLLYSKYEIDTRAGRITLGILVFQDIWAILILGLQPKLNNPELIEVGLSIVKVIILIIFSILVSKYILPTFFRSIAKIPELILLYSLGWCFLVSGIASYLDLSIEMGALVAGISISTFPFNLDVIAKVISIRDFFVTLFFVALGMDIPNPVENLQILGLAFFLSLYIIFTRILVITSILYAQKFSLRLSLIPSINLANISEFSLIIAALGYSYKHIDESILSLIIFSFVFNSIFAPYFIKYNLEINTLITKLLNKLGIKEKHYSHKDEEKSINDRDIVILGFFRVASSLIEDLETPVKIGDNETNLLSKISVIDFNHSVHEKLQALGVKSIYGDISHFETLRHSGIENAKLVLSTIPDTALVGTDNLKIIHKIQKLCPHAKIIVTAESPERALKMYAEGAHYVVLTRMIISDHLKNIITNILNNKADQLKNIHIEELKSREEIIK
jgi:Kef-type K+ transport system membrane component KefB/Trk K+ transport system NAD-binding subunit